MLFVSSEANPTVLTSGLSQEISTVGLASNLSVSSQCSTGTNSSSICKTEVFNANMAIVE